MSSLAKLMLCQGKKVSGSDIQYSHEVETLVEWGASVIIGSDPESVAGAELVVYTSAIKDDDPELTYARTNGIACIERQIFLSEVASDYQYIICIAGSHGKTTTTAMLAEVFDACSTQFTAHIGGNTTSHGNLIYKGNKFFITEACEYKRNLLYLRPDIAVVLNAEYDHPDTYNNLQQVCDTFCEFCSLALARGVAIVGKENGLYPPPKNAITYGLENENGYSLTNIAHTEMGCYKCDICNAGTTEAQLDLSISGIHNLFNATACYIVAMQCGLDPKTVIKSLNSFGGVARRFECKGMVKGCRIITDYAHHPTEITSAIATAKVQCEGKLHVVFQPHTYSRTASLFHEFTTCFNGADNLLLFTEYPARETPQCGTTCHTLYKAISAKNSNVCYYNNLLSLASKVLTIIAPNDILLICGAGDIENLTPLLFK